VVAQALAAEPVTPLAAQAVAEEPVPQPVLRKAMPLRTCQSR
jgi:hypothetical protein